MSEMFMRQNNCSLQTTYLFRDTALQWQELAPDGIHRPAIPEHLADQVFRVLLARKPGVFLFEALVSQQCPENAFGHIAKGVAKLDPEVAVINVVRHRGSGAHLIFWQRRKPRVFHHLDLDFAHLSDFDRNLVERLQRVTRGRIDELFRIIEGQAQSGRFFKTLRDHLQRVPCPNEGAYYALVDLVLKLIFLIFVQRKGWLNFDPYYLESKMALCHGRGLSIVQCFLKALFARLEGGRSREVLPLGTLPRLGGGLFQFQPELLPAIPNQWCLDLYETLISSYSFSLFEAGGDRQVLGIGPEVLGHVFENLLIHRDRKKLGTYFTPTAVAEKQVAQSFEAFMSGNGLEDNPAALAQRFNRIRVLDPSCGSGTYLVAAYRVMLRIALRFSPAEERYNGKLFDLKRRIMVTNLFGVDIHPMAVRLTEVRLWLNMIQDVEVADPTKAPALPSFRHHIRSGDFLGREMPIDSACITSWPKLAHLEKLRERFPFSAVGRRDSLLKHIHRLERELFEYSLRWEDRDRTDIARVALAQTPLPGIPSDGIQTALVKAAWPRRNLVWGIHVAFSRVILDQGFDLILGNPPWLSATQIPPRQKQRMARTIGPKGARLMKGQADLSLYFLAFSLELLRPGGHLGFLVPGKLLQAKYGAELRSLLQQRFRIDYLLDYGIDHNFLFGADTFPLALGVTARDPQPGHKVTIEKHGRDLFRRFEIAQSELGGRSGRWSLTEPLRPAGLAVTRDWCRLGDTDLRVKRGVVTGAKRYFVFSSQSDKVPAQRLVPLLRGRDIQAGSVNPGAYIYWPYRDGVSWYERCSAKEVEWLSRTGRTRGCGIKTRLPYSYRRFGNWILVWKYLAPRCSAALLRGTGWVPDQTTYYIEFDEFERAYRYFVYFNSEFANDFLKGLAERGKDRCFFFYAHTVEELLLAPDLEQRPLTIPTPRDQWVPAEGEGIWAQSQAGSMAFPAREWDPAND